MFWWSFWASLGAAWWFNLNGSKKNGNGDRGFIGTWVVFHRGLGWLPDGCVSEGMGSMVDAWDVGGVGVGEADLPWNGVFGHWR